MLSDAAGVGRLVELGDTTMIFTRHEWRAHRSLYRRREATGRSFEGLVAKPTE